MPAAVGIKLATPERPVVCLVGDGSALYAPQALWSAVQLGTAGHVHRGQQRALRDPRVVAAFGGLEGLPSLELPGIDLLAMAATFGCPAARVIEPGELGDAIRSTIREDGPMLLDVVVDPAVPPLLPDAPPVR